MPTPQEMLLEQQIIRAKQMPCMSWLTIADMVSAHASRYNGSPSVKISIEQTGNINEYGSNFVKDVIVTHENDPLLLSKVIHIKFILGLDDEKRKLIKQEISL
jgi:hypothetical protein